MAAEAERMLSEALTRVENIGSVIQASADSIQTLGNYTFSITAAVDMIGKIAKRINLIAINASIESTRAGLEGRAFGVIADEIRELADQTKSTTEIIRSTLVSVQSDVQREIQAVASSNNAIREGIDAVHKASDSLSRIMENSDTVYGMLASVVEATQDQASSMNEVVSNMNASLMLVEQTSNSLTESLIASEDLHELVNSLYKTLAMFKTGNDDAFALERNPEELSQELVAILRSNQSHQSNPALEAQPTTTTITHGEPVSPSAHQSSTPAAPPEDDIVIDLGDFDE
jgi:methyl-accepting chemotaxis protein